MATFRIESVSCVHSGRWRSIPTGKPLPPDLMELDVPSPVLGQLERVELRTVWTSESSDFTPWLAESGNIAVLGETLGLELEVESQEKNIGPFRADILCKDLTNQNWVLIENQLERTDHSHLGQLLTYAAGLQAVTIVWVAQRFTDEHRAALDWLNEVTDDGIHFFGVEVELWRIGSSPVAPRFNVVSQPNDWTRSVSDAAKRIQDGELSASQQRYIEFWTAFSSRVQSTNRSIRAPKPNADYWKNFSIGRSDFIVSAITVARDKWIGVQLVLYGPQAKARLRSLEAQKDAIEAQIGTPLVWRELPNHKESQVRLVRAGVNIEDRQAWTDQIDWLIDKVELFLKIFGPLVRSMGDSDAESLEPQE